MFMFLDQFLVYRMVYIVGEIEKNVICFGLAFLFTFAKKASNLNL